VDGVGVTGQAPTVVLLDGDGEPIRPAILWLDVRAAEEARDLEAILGPGRSTALGGNRMHAYYLGPKLAWLQRHEPRSIAATRMVLQSHAFIVLRLTGESTCDPSTAMLCTPLFDASQGTWSEEGARAVGVSRQILPRIARAHEIVGRVSGRVARLTGLREGTPVVAGGGDFAASALGAGVVEEGQACLMLGTAGNLLMPLRDQRFDDRLINSHHVGCDRWLALGGTLCGAALEWFRRCFAPREPWEVLEAEAREVSTGTGPIVIPYLQGERTPVWDEAARGALFGLNLSHGRGHVYRALLEGIALGFRDCMDVAREGGVTFREVVAANGAGRSALLRQTISNALGLPLRWVSNGRGTVAGSALLAAMGTGTFPAGSSWSAEGGVRHEPDAREHDRLTEALSRRRALFEAVRARG
jgi:xylulokinase